MPPAGYHSAKSPEQVFRYTYLPPTPGNLVFLGLPIPAGFAKGADRFRGPGRVRMTTPAQA